MSDQLKSIVAPELADVLLNLKQDILESFHAVKVGTIKSYDAAKHTAEVQVLFKRLLPDGLTAQSYAALVDVHVVTMQGGGGSIQFPVAAGDPCLLLFADRRLDEWFQNGGEAVPGDGRMHDLSDGLAIVGVNALNSALPAAPSDKVVAAYQGSSWEIDAAGLKLVGTGGAEVDLTGPLVTVKNNATTLMTLMTAFITALEALTILDDEGGAILPLTPASIAALEVVKTQFQALLG